MLSMTRHSAPLKGLATLALCLSLPAAAQTLPSWAAPSRAPSRQAPASPGLHGGAQSLDAPTPLSATASGVVAAPPDPGGVPGTPATPTQSVPLDGGLGLLALAGAGLAARRLRQPA